MQHNFHALLKEYWGYDQFRSMQLEIIQSIASGVDTIALLPTGGGKSLCFQLPILALQHKMAIVISPLIALMEDQVIQLKKRNIQAAMLSSSLSKRENQIILENSIQSAYRFLYISPERFTSQSFIDYLRNMPISYIAIDEAHCISQWGYDFRPSYRKLSVIKDIFPKTPIIAVTATANNQVLDNIKEVLQIEKCQLFKKSFSRDNIAIVIKNSERKIEDIIHIIKHIDGTGIIYLRNRKKTQELSQAINHRGFRSQYYHAGLSHEDRSARQLEWQEDRIKLMVCTNAFGMGIDKSNVRFVIHLDVPPSIEEYYQEIGRAGRDLEKSYAIALINDADILEAKELLSIHLIRPDELHVFYNTLFRYLKIAIHAGKDHSQQLIIDDLSQLINKPVYRIIQYLEELEKLGILEISAPFKYYNSVMISEDIEQYSFIKEGSRADIILKSILRKYIGAFHKHVDLEMTQLEQMTAMHRQDIISELIKLDRLGVVELHKAGHNPVITLLEDRLPAKRGLNRLRELKNKNKMKYERLDRMTRFLTSNMCRQKSILHYFDEECTDCGRCDYCLSQRISSSHMNQIKKRILLQKKKGLNEKDILSTFPENKRDVAMQVLKDIFDTL